MSEWPRLTSAAPVGGYRIRLTFSDGFVGEVDFGETVSRGGVFAFMKDSERFKAVSIAHGGTALQWIDDDGEEIDFDAYAQRMAAETNAVVAAAAE